MALGTRKMSALPKRTRNTLNEENTKLANEAWNLIVQGEAAVDENGQPSPEALTDSESYKSEADARKEGQRISRLALKVAPEGTKLTVKVNEEPKGSGAWIWSVYRREDKNGTSGSTPAATPAPEATPEAPTEPTADAAPTKRK